MHSAEIVPLPVTPRLPFMRAPAPSAPPRRGARPRIALPRPGEIGIAGIARLAGIADRAPRTIIATIRLLIDKRGFPMPKTPRFVAGEPVTGGAVVTVASLWDRDPVERWFEDDRPPAEARLAAELRRETVRADLAARARELAA